MRTKEQVECSIVDWAFQKTRSKTNAFGRSWREHLRALDTALAQEARRAKQGWYGVGA